jgi:hypothetical protein
LRRRRKISRYRDRRLRKLKKKKPRFDGPLPTATNEAARKIASPDISEGLLTPDTPPRTNTAKVSTCRRSRRQIQLRLIETSEAQLDDDADYVDDDADLSGTAPPPDATVNALTRRRKSRRVIPTSSTGTPLPPPTATVEALTRRQSRSRRLPQLPPIETIEAQLYDNDDGDMSGRTWDDRLSELADYRKLHGHYYVPYRYRENTKLGLWIGNQRKQYRLQQKESNRI